MSSFEFVSSFCVGLLSLAYPIIIQLISSIDEKYNSATLVELFKNEKSTKWFLFFLKCSLLFLFIVFISKALFFPICDSTLIYTKFFLNEFHLILFHPWFQYKLDFEFWRLTVFFTLIIPVCLMVFSFLLMMKNAIIYLSRKNLYKYIVKPLSKETNKQKTLTNFNKVLSLLYRSKLYNFFIKHFVRNMDEEITHEAISDLMIHSIRIDDLNGYRTIETFLMNSIAYSIGNSNNEESKLQNWQIAIIRRGNYELAKSVSPNYFIAETSLLGMVFIGNYSQKFSDTTYRIIWDNLLMFIKLKNDEMVFSYWKDATSYVRDVKIRYNRNTSNNKDSLREFEHFNYKLGGLLLKEKRYNLISRLFKYTSNDPPVYELLPQVIENIYSYYIELSSSRKMGDIFIASHFRFPNIDGLMGDYEVKQWIYKYMALLYVRQWTLRNNYVINNPISLPHIPPHLDEKIRWLNKIDYFGKLVTEILLNKELVEAIDFTEIIASLQAPNEENKALDLLDKLKAELEHKKTIQLKEQAITIAKTDEYNKEVERVFNNFLTPFVDDFKCVSKENKTASYLPNHTTTQFIHKGVFNENQGIDYGNLFISLPYHFANLFIELFSMRFLQETRKTYLVRKQDFKEAIAKLVGDKLSGYSIISFGDLEFINSLVANSGINIINRPINSYMLFNEAIFLIQKNDLPCFGFGEPKASEIEKYSLKGVNPDMVFKVYSNVLDLNRSENEEIKRENLDDFRLNYPNEDIEKYALAVIAFNPIFFFSTNFKVIRLNIESPYNEKGIPCDIDDIQPFDLT